MEHCVFSGEVCCKILARDNCKGCSFMKNQKQLEEGREKALARLETLPIPQQLHIAKKYYPRGIYTEREDI